MHQDLTAERLARRLRREVRVYFAALPVYRALPKRPGAVEPEWEVADWRLLARVEAYSTPDALKTFRALGIRRDAVIFPFEEPAHAYHH
jgi:hypothetical protein